VSDRGNNDELPLGSNQVGGAHFMSLVQRTVLDNGVRVLSECIPHAGSLGLSVLIDASPQDDPHDLHGLAHLSEHAVFWGTSTRCEEDIARLIDEAGGQMGAFTARDYTCFYAHVLADYGTYALDLLGDLLLHATVPDEQLTPQREAVLQEIDGALDSPSDWINDQLKSSVWHDHPLGRPILGDSDSVLRATTDHLRKFIRTQYSADRIILSAAGAVDHQSLVEQVQDAFWQLDSQPIDRRREPLESRSCVVAENRDLRQTHFAIGFQVPAYAWAQRYALHVFRSALGGGLSSRLHRRLRDQRGLVYDISAQLHTYGQGGMLVVEAATSPDRLIPAVALTLIEIAQLVGLQQPIDDEELWKARMQVRGQARLASDLISTRVSRLATQEFYFGRQFSDQEMLAGIDAVSVEDLQQISADILQPSFAKAGVVVLGPGAASRSLQQELRQVVTDITGSILVPSESLGA
jgi:predicted Zn-dependent peptidase